MDMTALTNSSSTHVRPRASAEPLDALVERACRPAPIDPADAAVLADLGQEHRVMPGTLVLRRGDVAGGLWLVAQGRVALGLRGPQGMRQHRVTVEGGQWLDLASALLESRYPEDAVAETPATLWEFPIAAVQRAGMAHPSVMRALAARLAAGVHELIGGTRDLMMKDVQARCASWLLEHAVLEPPAEGRQIGVLRLQERKRAIALQLGTTAETFSRTLRELSRMGLIDVQGYSIALLDVDTLRSLAQPLPAAA